MLMLLPPSEGKTAPSRGRPLDLTSLGFPALTAPRAQALEALVNLCTADPRAAQTLGLGPTQGEEVHRNAELKTAPTARAERVYTGVLYDVLDLPGLGAAARRRAASSLAVVSSLFGLVRPGDRIPAYRLAGDVSLPRLGPVAALWRAPLGEVVPAAVGHGLLVDLRSSTYAGFWRPDRAMASRVAAVRVLHERDGRRTVVSHFNKATKGRIVRALLEDGARTDTPDALARRLQQLGWTVETGRPTTQGTRLDVVVTGL